jgi:hypothetical protein
MKHGLFALAAAAMCLQLAGIPVHAEMSSDEKAAAAIAILGIAALAHNKHHYREGYAPQTGDHTAEFERGYRDGMHGYSYNTNGSTVDYAEGYQAGDKERSNSMAHRQNSASGVRVPKAAMDACFNDAVNGVFQTNPHNVHVIKAAQEGSDNFYIELASGHKHVVCSVNSRGEIFNTEYRRL